jgi:hypothetical protein
MAAYIAANLPPSNSGFFAWTVAFHNAVNRKCGKPEMTIDEAIRLAIPANDS